MLRRRAFFSTVPADSEEEVLEEALVAEVEDEQFSAAAVLTSIIRMGRSITEWAILR